MSHKNFEKTDNTEKVENVEKSEKTEGKEKESLLSKAKNFFAEHGKGKEEKGESEQKTDKADEVKQKLEEKRQSFAEGLKVGAPSQEKQAEVAKAYREKHNLDEHGNSLDKNAKRPEGGFERERGDDDPRSRWEDAEEDNKENTENTGDKNTDEE